MLKIILSLWVAFALVHSNDYKFEEGKIIYEATCTSCHGTDGNTNPQMQLLIQPRQLSKSILTKEQSFQVIKEGAHFWGAHADIMPTFKYVYSDDELEHVAHYIAKAFNPDRDVRVKQLLDISKKLPESDVSQMLITGEKIFKRNCSKCHGITGNGEGEYVQKSKKEKSFIYPYNLQRTLLNEEQLFLYAKYGGKYWGTIEDDMPSWKIKYNDYELKSVAKYVNENIKKIK